LNAPQSLTADEVYAVIAWLLHLMWITESDTAIEAQAAANTPGTGLSQTRDRMGVVHNTTRSTIHAIAPDERLPPQRRP